jgi:hypothetical protein
VNAKKRTSVDNALEPFCAQLMPLCFWQAETTMPLAFSQRLLKFRSLSFLRKALQGMLRQFRAEYATSRSSASFDLTRYLSIGLR